MSLILYQFPLSHFCEKVRWALDYKGLDYKLQNLVPGSHIKVTKNLAPGSSVPVLSHDGKIIQDSTKIITYLDEQFPQKKLTPINAQERQAVLEWERYLDQEAGIHVRRYLYHTWLKHPGIVCKLLATGQGVWVRWLLRFVYFSKLSKGMRRYMDINDDTAAQSKQVIEKTLKRLNEALQDKKFLVGNCFTRADLTAAALLAPLFMPAQYGLPWPPSAPEPLHSEIQEMASDLSWVKGTYNQHR